MGDGLPALDKLQLCASVRGVGRHVHERLHFHEPLHHSHSHHCQTTLHTLSCPDRLALLTPADHLQGTILTNLQVCINCTQIDGLAAGTVTQYQIDILNAAQQQLAQACVEDGFPSSFTGAVPTPTTVTYPSGVDQATYASNSTSTTSSAASTTSASVSISFVYTP